MEERNEAEPSDPQLDVRPWLRIEERARETDWEAVRALVGELDEADWIHAASHLPADVLADVLEEIDSESAAVCLDRLPKSQAAETIGEIEPHAAAAIIEELPSDARVDLLGQVDAEDVDAILAEATRATGDEARTLLAYPPDTAGGLMATECFSVVAGTSVGELTAQLRSHPEFADFQIQYIYVSDARGRLVGVLPLRSLVLAPPERMVSQVMIPEPVHVVAEASIGELEALFDQFGFLGVPVVDADLHLLGVVHRADFEEAGVESAQAETMKALGIASGEELRSMPLVTRSRRRLAWLSINVGLNVLAASVIAAYQDTLQAVIALAVFLPMISDMSGCSGNQAVAVSLRELSLGVLRPNEFLRVWAKEATLGLLNGLALGVLIGLVAAVWQGNATLGLVVGAALAVNTVVAVSLGGTIPLAIRGLGQDPALASGPVLTTVTDMCGFFLALSFATIALDRLVV